MNPEAKRPRVAFVAQWLQTAQVGPVWWTATALTDQGFQVGIITSGARWQERRPLHNPLNDWHLRSDPFPVLQVPAYHRYDASPARRIASIASFAASSTLLTQPSLDGSDVCLVYGSPATSVTPALVANMRTGLPYVMYIQDLWPDSIFATGYLDSGLGPKAVKIVFDPYLAEAYRRASHLVTITPGMRQTLIDRGVPPEKVSVVYNWVDEVMLSPRPPTPMLRDRLGIPSDEFVLIYTGNIGRGQAIDNVVRALSLNGEAGRLHLVLLGAGSETGAVTALAAALGVSNLVHVLDPVPAEKVPDYTAGADACLVSLADEPIFNVTLPSKTQAALAQGKPVLAVGRGDLANVITEAGAGWTCPPDDPGTLAGVLSRLSEVGKAELQALGASGLAFYRARMGRQAAGHSLGQILRQAVAERESRPH